MRTPGDYRPRLVDAPLDALLRSAGAVLIEGPKWCGKTWTGMAHAQSAVWVADPTSGYLARRIAHTDPASLLSTDKPVLLDEWRDAPGLWDAVRLEVDRHPGPGQFLLTDSATPRDDVVSHSGTGRIARIAMWPMTLAEAGLSTGDVRLSDLMDGATPTTTPSAWTMPQLIEAVVRGGWPGALDLPLADAVPLPRSYLKSVAYADASQIDGTRRDPARLSALLASLGRNTSTLVSTATLSRDLAADGSQTSAKTVTAYLDVLRRLHVLHEIPAWAPALRSPVRLRQSPKRMLCDPSLAAAAIGASVQTLQADRKTLGLLFETLCLRDLCVYAQSLDGKVSHYHDNTDLEVDAVVQLADGRWAGIEIKLGPDQEDAAARSLLGVRRKMLAAGEPPPSALIVLVGPGSFTHRREDGVVIVPVDRLTA